ncbi:hypothetical protein ACFV4K_34885, partial [Nocardia sp. NPDC059764]|uniref:hypothetical protein n=1 Tax=Nocardia sp. NPDC059764 TaxID=3346939 RepID=UPI0036542283
MLWHPRIPTSSVRGCTLQRHSAGGHRRGAHHRAYRRCRHRAGTLEDIAAVADSYTGQFLKDALAAQSPALAEPKPAKKAAANRPARRSP